MDLTTKLFEVTYASPVFNASGPLCTTEEEIRELADSKSALVMTKTCTKNLREGNPGKRYADIDRNSINAMGLPNPGCAYFKDLLQKFWDEEQHKKFFVSVSGDDLECAELFAGMANVMAIEVNLSCPNLAGKPQICYDEDAVTEKLQELDERLGYQLPWGIKLSPYFDQIQIKRMADIFNQSEFLAFITCINSLGNALVFNNFTDLPIIEPNRGLGGYGGEAIKPFGLSNVYQFRQALRPDIEIIGVGGVTCGKDVYEYLRAGASMVQVGTAYQQEGPDVFQRIEDGLQHTLESRKINSVADIRKL